MFVSCKSNRVETKVGRERERGGDFKHLVPMGSSEKTRQVDTHNLGEVYKG